MKMLRFSSAAECVSIIHHYVFILRWFAVFSSGLLRFIWFREDLGQSLLFPCVVYHTNIQMFVGESLILTFQLFVCDIINLKGWLSRNKGSPCVCVYLIHKVWSFAFESCWRDLVCHSCSSLSHMNHSPVNVFCTCSMYVNVDVRTLGLKFFTLNK